MNVSILPLRFLSLYFHSFRPFRTCISDRLTHRLSAALLLFALLFITTTPTLTSAYAGIGSYVSEKLLSRTSGNGTASIYLSQTTSAGPIVVGGGPTVSTSPQTAAVTPGGSATLTGVLSSLNGFPSADVWFVWGYSPSAMTNTTTATTVAAIGTYTASISGLASNRTVYFQFRGSSDGTRNGNTASFPVQGWGYILLWTLLPITIAVSLAIAVLKLTGNWVAVLVAVALGILAMLMVYSMLGVLW